MLKIKNTIVVIGNKYAGVTTAATYIADKFSIDRIVVGKDSISKSMQLLVDNMERSLVIEKLGGLKDLEFLKDQTHCVLIAISADEKSRYTRLQARWGKIQPQTYEEFIKEEVVLSGSPQGKELAQLMSQADYTIPNNGTLDDFYSKLNELIGTVDARKLR